MAQGVESKLSPSLEISGNESFNSNCVRLLGRSKIIFVFQVTFSKIFGSVGRKKSFSMKKVYAIDFILYH